MTGALTSLLTNPEAMSLVYNAIVDAVAVSYVTHPVRHRTAAEDKRRTRICIEAFKHMRGDLHWSVQKAADLLTITLQQKLDTLDFVHTEAQKKRRYWWGK